MSTGRLTPIARPIDSQRAFTLVELLIACVVAGVLLLAAGPAYRDWIASQQLANHAHFLVDRLHQARSESIKSGYRVNLCKSRDGKQCSDAGGWESGWIMYVDENQNGEVDEGEPVIASDPAATNQITVSGNKPVEDYVSYTSLGHARMLSGALQMGTFVVCKPGQTALHVVLANSGRVRIDPVKDRCP